MKVAVLVPVYNSAAYFPQCLDSLLAQTYPGVEVFCHDDGSTDAALEIARAYARDNPGRVHVQAWANHGAVPTINRLLDDLPEAFDAYLMVDCDDYVHPRMVEVLVSEMERERADVVECAFVNVAPEVAYPQGFHDVGAYGKKVITDMSVYRLRKTAPGAWILRWNKLYRRSAVAGLRLRDGLEYEGDFFFGYEVNAAISKKVIIDARLYAYRWNPHSATSRVNYRKYVHSALERVRLSSEVFLKAGRIPERMVTDFRKELAKDACRMCIRKNLKKNRDAKSRRELFAEAGRSLRQFEKLYSLKPIGLNPIQRLAWHACAHDWYCLGRALAYLI